MPRVLCSLLCLSLLWSVACDPLPARTGRDAPSHEDALLPALEVSVGDAPAKGPPDAEVTIVEFLDLECPYCRYAHPTIERLLAEHPGRVRWVIKHHPLGFHQRATAAALLAIEVREQRGDAAFFEAVERLLAVERLDADVFNRVMEEFELDPQRVAKAFALGPSHPTLVEDGDQAMDLAVRGTPSFFVNGIPLQGAQPHAEFERVVSEQLERASALLQSGVRKAELYAVMQREAVPPPALQKVEVPNLLATTSILGARDAPVTVQIFSDFECPYCSSVMPTLDELLAAYPGRVRIAWRHYPLPFHKHAVLAARAAEQARAQGGDEAFWKLARRMLGTRELPPERLDVATLERYAAELGLDPRAFREGLLDERHGEVIERDMAIAERAGIHATPGFIINGYRLLGAHPVRRFERLVRLSLEERAGTEAASLR